MSRNTLLIFLMGVALVVGGGFAYSHFSNSGKRLVQPHRGPVIEGIYGLGTVMSDKVFHMRSALTLQVRKIVVREGDIVKAGDPLIRLDENWSRSPIDGTVTEVTFKEGELVAPQVSILTVTNMQSLYLEVTLEQQSILRVQKGQTVNVSFESLRSEKVEGVVKQVYPRQSQFVVRIEIPTWPKGVLPGMTADAAIMVGKKSDALLIPLRAIVAGQVTRVRNGTKERIAIQIGNVDGEWAEVTSDNLTEADQVVLRGP